MLALEWTQAARADLLAIIDYRLPGYPKLYKPGRVRGTREMVVRPNYIVVYKEEVSVIRILRVLHAAQCWPV